MVRRVSNKKTNDELTSDRRVRNKELDRKMTDALIKTRDNENVKLAMVGLNKGKIKGLKSIDFSENGDWDDWTDDSGRDLYVLIRTTKPNSYLKKSKKLADVDDFNGEYDYYMQVPKKYVKYVYNTQFVNNKDQSNPMIAGSEDTKKFINFVNEHS